MYSNIEDVISWLIMNRVQNFVVFQAGREDSKMNNNCILNCTFEDDTTENKRQSLIDCLNNYGVGDYVIKQVDSNSKNAMCKVRISGKKEDQQQTAQINSLPQPGYMSKTEVDALLSKQQSEFQQQVMMDKLTSLQEILEEQNKELEERNSAMDNFLKQITPFVAPVLQGLLGRSARVPSQIGVLDSVQDDSNNTDFTDEELDRIFAVLAKWREYDSDYIKILEGLTNLFNTPTYKMAKDFIIK